jgi:hydroxymethylglutaryl-CoA synthase
MLAALRSARVVLAPCALLTSAMRACGRAVSRSVGNCYTAAVYMNLLSLASGLGEQLEGKRVLMFSYGSGAVATAFVIHARAPTGHNSLSLIGKHATPFTLARLQAAVDVPARLASRAARDVAVFSAAMDLRARRYGACDYEPAGSVDELFPGAYYLTKVDALHRRTYARKPDPLRRASSRKLV